MVPRGVIRLAAAAAVAAAVLLLALAPVADGRTMGPLSLDVSFLATGSITVTLPDGTPVGTTSGAPTVIPAGYYEINLSGPGGCTTLPHFILKGPGESIFDNLLEGEVENFTYNADLQPNSTYTWSSDGTPGVVHTFATSSVVGGTPPPQVGPNGLAASKHTTVSSTALVGSGVAPFRGKLAAAVSAAGRVSLRYRGKAAASLRAGRYTIAVSDRSRTSGVVLEKAGRRPVVVTGGRFVGTRTATFRLTAGRWLLLPRAKAKAGAEVVVA